MNGVALVQSIIEILVAGITGLATGIGEGLSALVTNIFLTTEGDLSAFGVMVVVFGGISLCISLSRLVVRWLSSLGGSRI